MKTNKLFTHLLTALILATSACAVSATEEIDKSKKNSSILDPRVPSQFIPIESYDVGESVSFSFIDKKSIKLHPYNRHVRTYTRVINYGPQLMQTDADGKKTPYSSMTIEEFVNCDDKEFAKGTILTHSGFFSEGELKSTNNTPKRWEATTKGSKERQNLIIVCSLPLN